MRTLDRQAVLAHRARVHGLHGDKDTGVLRVGLQDAPSGSAGHGLAVRSGDPRAGDDPDLVRVLSIRGAPHVHGRADLPMVRRELRPRRPEDLLIWLGGHGPAILDSDMPPLEVLDQTISLLHQPFSAETGTKGVLSAAISPDLPAPARPWCATCRTEHVIENLFRLATLLAGLELERGDRRLVFRAGPEPRGWAEIVAELAPVRIDGTAYRMDVDELDAPPPPAAVLLPPRDPYLLGHREFLVPDREIARQVWRPQVSPGVLLVDGEVRGTWRHRASGRTLHLHVTPFGKLRKGIRGAVGDQAELLAAVRGAGALHAHVVWQA